MSLAEFYAKQSGKPYRPSNGTEGECFRGEFCERCQFDSEKRPCKILLATMWYDTDDKEYPKEWVYTLDGPTCTKFQLRGSVPSKPRRRIKPAKNQPTLFDSIPNP